MLLDMDGAYANYGNSVPSWKSIMEIDDMHLNTLVKNWGLSLSEQLKLTMTF